MTSPSAPPPVGGEAQEAATRNEAALNSFPIRCALTSANHGNETHYRIFHTLAREAQEAATKIEARTMNALHQSEIAALNGVNNALRDAMSALFDELAATINKLDATDASRVNLGHALDTANANWQRSYQQAQANYIECIHAVNDLKAERDALRADNAKGLERYSDGQRALSAVIESRTAERDLAQTRLTAALQVIEDVKTLALKLEGDGRHALAVGIGTNVGRAQHDAYRSAAQRIRAITNKETTSVAAVDQSTGDALNVLLASEHPH